MELMIVQELRSLEAGVKNSESIFFLKVLPSYLSHSKNPQNRNHFFQKPEVNFFEKCYYKKPLSMIFGKVFIGGSKVYSECIITEDFMNRLLKCIN